MTRDDVHALVTALPLVEEGTTHGMPSYKAAGKFLTRIRDEDDSLVVYLDSIDEREMLIEAEPQTFHLTDHYRGYPIVLARLETVDPDWLSAKLTARWRKLVPAKARKVHGL